MVHMVNAEFIDRSQRELLDAQVDITGAAFVEITRRKDDSVVWVNVNGICVLRICRIKNLNIGSMRGSRNAIR